MRLIVILTCITMLLAACGGDDEPAPPTAEATAPATEAPTQTIPVVRVTPTPFTGTIPRISSTAGATTPAVLPTSAAVLAATVAPLPSATMESIEGKPVPPPGIPIMAGDIDCGGFESLEEAQIFFLNNGGPLDDLFGLDSNNDGIACNAVGDAGFGSITFAVATATATVDDVDCANFQTWQEANEFFISEGGPRSDPHRLDPDRDGIPCTGLKNAEENPRATPTFPPARPAAGVWSDEVRTEELNGINWQAFAGRDYGFGVAQRVTAGEMLWARIRGEDGVMGEEAVEMDCAPRFGNRLDERNPSFDERIQYVWLWIEPTGSETGECVLVDRYRNWSELDPEPLMRVTRFGSFPRASRGLPLVFTDPIAGPRFHTLPPADLFDLEIFEIGKSVSAIEGDFECQPEKLPVAVWSEGMGFEVVPPEEEELLARNYFVHFTDESGDELWASYDWDSKGRWREAGWYLVLYGWEYVAASGKNKHWESDVLYAGLGRDGCWFVPNRIELPPARYCLECERRDNMALMAERPTR